MAVQAKGIYGKTIIDYETTYGESPAVRAGLDMPFITNELTSKQNTVKSNVITGTRNDSEPGYGNTDVSGAITTPLDLASIGYWLKGVIGSPVTTGEGPDYTHVFKIGDTLPSMVIERLLGSTRFLYNGCKVNTFKISVGGDQELTTQIDLAGSISTVGSVAYDASPTVVTQTDKLNNFKTSIKIGGTVAASVIKSGDFSINNGLDLTAYTIGSNGFRSDIAEGMAGCSGSLKTLFKDTTFLDYGINQTKTSIEILWTLAANKSLSFLFPEVKFNRTDPTLSGPGGVEVDLAWEGFHQSDSANSIIVATLKNQVASY